MTEQRMIEILAEAKHEMVDLYDAEFWIGIVKAKLQDSSPGIVAALAAMQRAVEEETATLRAEVERLKGYATHKRDCETRKPRYCIHCNLAEHLHHHEIIGNCYHDKSQVFETNDVRTCTCGLDSPPANG